MLWLSLHFPDLPLELFTRGRVAGPFALTVGKATRRAIFRTNAEAAASGVAPGMAVSGALALLPALSLRARDEAAERAALEGLAAWAGQFTSLVSLSAGRFPALLLEVEGSLALFGGREPLLAALRSGVADLGYRALAAAAPTPLGAELLARAGEECWLAGLPELGRRLEPLSLGTLGLPPEVQKSLGALGVRTLRDAGTLPRSGLARRFGPELPDLLARASGEAHDPRVAFVPPPLFEARLELPAEVSACEPLLFAARRLLVELEGFLKARGGGVEGFRLRLFGRERAPLDLRIELAAPGRDAGRLLGLLRERLERVSLPGPVSAVGLRAAGAVTLSPRPLDFFGPAGADKGREGTLLVERLRARLGEGAVQGLRLAADHRPERSCHREAFQVRASPPSAPDSPGAARPLWLLPEPKPLRPEALTFVAGPERIDTGWWDGAVARDYYVAEDAEGARLWVFREGVRGSGWFVHGIFA